MRWLVIFIIFVSGCSNKPTQEAPKPKVIDMKLDSAALIDSGKAMKPPESPDEYKKSTKKIGRDNAPIFYKEFLKAPERFKGQRVNFVGKILHIEESQGITSVQVVVTSKYDSIMVHYPDTIKIYDGDWVSVYGEVADSFDGVNRMGATMKWPLVMAKYIKKNKSGD